MFCVGFCPFCRCIHPSSICSFLECVRRFHYNRSSNACFRLSTIRAFALNASDTVPVVEPCTIQRSGKIEFEKHCLKLCHPISPVFSGVIQERCSLCWTQIAVWHKVIDSKVRAKWRTNENKRTSPDRQTDGRTKRVVGSRRRLSKI